MFIPSVTSPNAAAVSRRRGGNRTPTRGHRRAANGHHTANSTTPAPPARNQATDAGSSSPNSGTASEAPMYWHTAPITKRTDSFESPLADPEVSAARDIATL